MSQLNRFFSSVFSIPRLSSFAALSLALTVLSCLFASPQAQAQTLTVLHSFLGPEGQNPPSDWFAIQPATSMAQRSMVAF